jgi:cytochrome b pre-mRNA-processing protein 3
VKLFDFSSRTRVRNAAHRLYTHLVAQARRPEFYLAGGVPDTVEGRFEMISLHVYLALRRLRGADAEGRKLSQYLFDAMFDDMDRNLREMGTGDLGVGRKVKGLAKVFYGRVRVYDRALDGTDAGALEEALAANVFADADAPQTRVAALAEYLRREDENAKAWRMEDLVDGRAAFGPPVSPAPQTAGEGA